MRRLLPAAGLLPALLVTGCASRGGPPSGQDTASVEAACVEAVGQAAAGDHQVAAEGLAKLEEAGATCPTDEMALLEDSRRRLEEADALARQGLAARDAGDLEAASRSFSSALEIYPRYHWVRRLDEEVRLARSDWVADLLDRARRAQASGRLELASQAALQALAARPAGAVLDEAVAFGSQLGHKLFSAGEFLAAEALWRAALALDPSDARLARHLHALETTLRTLEAIVAEDGGPPRF